MIEKQVNLVTQVEITLRVDVPQQYHMTEDDTTLIIEEIARVDAVHDAYRNLGTNYCGEPCNATVVSMAPVHVRWVED